MEKIDARKLKPEIQQYLRQQVIRLRKAGNTYKQISQIVGIHPTNACKLYKAYEANGAKAIQGRKRGRKVGSCRTLSKEQEKRLQRAITDKTPDQLKFAFALWTRRAVQELIFQLFKIEMPIRTVGEYLHRWGFTPQKPLRRAYEQNPGAVKTWLDKQYPAIVQKARQHHAQIYWADETGLRSDCQHGRGYAPCGKTPVINLCAKRQSINLISAITNQGTVRFMVYQNTLNSQTLIKFLKRLIKDAKCKVFLILDNLRVHHSKPVKEWIEQHNEQIELFFGSSLFQVGNPKLSFPPMR